MQEPSKQEQSVNDQTGVVEHQAIETAGPSALPSQGDHRTYMTASGQKRIAVVTETPEHHSHVSLHVFHLPGDEEFEADRHITLHTNVPYDEQKRPGTWH